MRNKGESIVILLADNDEEDPVVACDALTESRMANDIFCVEDSNDSMAYLHRSGKYTGLFVVERAA